MPTVFNPPTPTYTALATITLGSTDSEIVFSSIPATYRDLVLVFEGSTQAVGDIWYRLNGDTGSNYSYVIMYGTGSAASSGSGTPAYGAMHYNNTTSRFMVTCNFFDVSATDKHKTAISRGNQADGFVMSYATRWANTSAVTSLTVGTNGTNYLSGTTFSLYGIAA
jgi:hypothetical protein